MAGGSFYFQSTHRFSALLLRQPSFQKTTISGKTEKNLPLYISSLLFYLLPSDKTSSSKDVGALFISLDKTSSSKEVGALYISFHWFSALLLRQPTCHLSPKPLLMGKREESKITTNARSSRNFTEILQFSRDLIPRPTNARRNRNCTETVQKF